MVGPGKARVLKNRVASDETQRLLLMTSQLYLTLDFEIDGYSVVEGFARTMDLQISETLFDDTASLFCPQAFCFPSDAYLFSRPMSTLGIGIEIVDFVMPFVLNTRPGF